MQPRFGPYQVIRKLGQGGMGDVYLAHDPRLRRDVAVKTLTAARAGSALAWERLLREARATARLRHPNIVQVFELEPEADPPFMVMEAVRGRTLTDLLGSKFPDELIGLVAVVARAVHAAHEAGIVHRDLKPDNMLVEDDTGRVVVADFGLARDSELGDASLTGTGVAVGTPAYMAPEQATANRSAQGPATDVWALGVILYELLTGSMPFRGDSAVELLMHVTRGEPEPPSRVADVSSGLEALCLAALTKDPAGRPTALAFAEALERELAGAGSAPPPTPTPTKNKPPSGRRKADTLELPPPPSARAKKTTVAKTSARGTTVAVDRGRNTSADPRVVGALCGAAGLLLVVGLVLAFRKPAHVEPIAVVTPSRTSPDSL